MLKPSKWLSAAFLIGSLGVTLTAQAANSDAPPPKTCKVDFNWAKESPDEIIQGVAIRKITGENLDTVELMFKERFKERCGREWTEADGHKGLREQQKSFLTHLYGYMGDKRSPKELSRLLDSIIDGLLGNKPFTKNVPGVTIIPGDKRACIITLHAPKKFTPAEYLQDYAAASWMVLKFASSADVRVVENIIEDHEKAHCLGHMDETTAQQIALNSNLNSTVTHPDGKVVPVGKIATLEVAGASLIAAFFDFVDEDFRKKYGYKMYSVAMDALGLPHTRLNENEYEELGKIILERGVLDNLSYQNILSKFRFIKATLNNPKLSSALSELIEVMHDFIKPKSTFPEPSYPLPPEISDIPTATVSRQ